MRNSIIQVFNNYGLFGKSVPGAFLLLGVSVLAPYDSLPLGEVDSLSFVNIAALLAVLLIAGLTLGQAVHTAADNFEKVFLWFARGIRRIYNGSRARFINLKIWIFDFERWKIGGFGRWNSLVESAEWTYNQLDGWFTERVLESDYWKWLQQEQTKVAKWFQRRYWGGYDSLAGHRYLFGKCIHWNFARQNDHRWETESKGPLYDEFARCYSQKFDIEVRQQTPEDLVSQYPLLTSYLEGHSRTQYRHFQSIYSFCRSMWVVSLALGIVYTMALVDVAQIPNLFDHTPAIYEVSERYQLFFPLSAFTAWLFFFDASGTYKRHFVEYFMASFVHCYHEQTGDEGSGIQSKIVDWPQ